MILYNMMNGVNTMAVFFILPSLGKHPDEYPRFRDAFIGDPERTGTDGKIIIYTRTGGGNREHCADENAAIRAMDGFLFDYDDDFDGTYANWVFDIPDKWKDDIEKLLSGRAAEVSDEYRDLCQSVFPKIADKIKANFDAVRTVHET